MSTRPAPSQQSARGPWPRLPGQAASDTPPGLARLALIDSARRVLPALAVAIAVGIYEGALGDGMITGFTVAVFTVAMLRVPLPLHLLPLSTAALIVAAPLLACLGIVAAAELGADADSTTFTGDLLLPVGTAILVGAAVELFGRALMRRRPVRVATIGSPAFAEALQRELEETGIDFVDGQGWIDLHDPEGRGEDLDRLAERIAERTRRAPAST